MFVYLRVPTSLGKATLWKALEILKTHKRMLILLRKPVIYWPQCLTLCEVLQALKS